MAVFNHTRKETPYCGENTPVEKRQTVHGSEALTLECGDRVAIWVSGHWHIGTVLNTSHRSSTVAGQSREILSGVIKLDSIHRDAHDNLPTKTLKITSDNYRNTDGEWDTLDVSVRTPDSESGTVTLLGICGGLHQIED